VSSTTYTKEYYKAFVAGPAFFERLEKLLSANGIHAAVTAKMSDSSQIDGLSIDEFTQLANSKNRRIMSVEISSGYKDELRLNLVLNREYGAPITFRVVGDDKNASYLASELEKLLRERFQKHSYFSAMPPVHRGFWWAALQILGVGLVATSFLVPRFAWVGLVGAFVVWIPQLYWPIVRRIIPSAIFEIGDGAERHAAVEARRRRALSLIFVLIGLAIATNIASNILYDTFWKK
jgi:hypothetical protein